MAEHNESREDQRRAAARERMRKIRAEQTPEQLTKYNF